MGLIIQIALIALIFACSSTAKPSSRHDCEVKLTACLLDSNANRTVCGDDHQTYSSRCHIIKQRCEGGTVSMKYRGPCKDIDVPACVKSLQYAQKMAQPAQGTRFMPKCLKDGSYAPVQCNSNSCWCVTAQGERIANTSVTSGRPNCGKKEKSDTIRRHSIKGSGNREDCSKSDKAQFNMNLINEFTNDYNRQNPSKQLKPDDKDSAVMEWKFKTLDKNHDNSLDRNEFRQIRKHIKKVIEPKRCVKLFLQQCMDRDELITRHEWMNCIQEDTYKNQGGARAPGDNKRHSALNEDRDDYDEDGHHLSGPSGGKRADRRLHRRRPIQKIQRAMATQLLQISTPRVPSQGYNDELDRNRDDREANDCLSDKNAQLENHKSGDHVYYIPDCMPDGRYQPMQCYRSTGYCWCVHKDTGNPIPGTSMKDSHPNCDAIPTPSRPMKGCLELKKVQFLRDLMEFLKAMMISNINGTVLGQWQASKEEQIATWSFVMLDKNQNKVLERKEWKNFRQLIIDNNKLKHCGKKLPRYCDVNYDDKISLTEWINCLNAQRGFNGPETTSVNSTTFSKRKGKNPLDSYLKAD